MSPTVFREKGYRFYFFSLEEDRMHVHVACSDGDAKFWLEPVRLASSVGFAGPEMRRLDKLVREHQTPLLEAWHDYFAG